MSDAPEFLLRQADWQRSRAALPWPEKIRMAERVRESVLRLRRSGQPGGSLHPDLDQLQAEESEIHRGRATVRQERGGAGAARAQALADIAIRMTEDRSNPARRYRNVRVSLEVAAGGGITFAAGSPDIVLAVARQEVDVAALNPSAYLTMAHRGTGPFKEPLPVVALAVMPSWDRMAFAVTERTGVHTLGDLREKRYPLRLSVRESITHATRFLVDEVLDAEGISLKDIEGWGGKIEYVDTPSHASRLDGIEQGTIDAVFDEGVKGWGRFALQHGMQFLPLGEAAARRLQAIGWSLGPTPRSQFPGLAADVSLPSFSGWPIITHASLPDDDAYAFCRALEGVFEGIRWDSEKPVALKDVCTNTDATDLEAPLHPGAERFYRERGCLG